MIRASFRAVWCKLQNDRSLALLWEPPENGRDAPCRRRYFHNVVQQNFVAPWCFGSLYASPEVLSFLLALADSASNCAKRQHEKRVLGSLACMVGILRFLWRLDD